MNAEEWAALLAIATAMSFTPGPNTTLSTALGANLGLRRAWPFIVAVPVGWALLMLACGLGLGAVMLAVPVLHWIVKGVGVAYLLWLAWTLAGMRMLGDEVPQPRLHVSFFQGVLLQFVNIKAWLLALALTSGWVASAAGAPAANPGERLLLVCSVMVLFAFASNLAYAMAGSLMRQWLSQGRRLMGFNRVMAAVLVATAVWMLLS
jgi:threonine/homoserine/homoserine lactone efflux protein